MPSWPRAAGNGRHALIRFRQTVATTTGQEKVVGRPAIAYSCIWLVAIRLPTVTPLSPKVAPPLAEPAAFPQQQTFFAISNHAAFGVSVGLRSPGRASGAGFGLALAAKLARMDPNPVPNRPGRRPRAVSDWILVRSH